MKTMESPQRNPILFAVAVVAAVIVIPCLIVLGPIWAIIVIAVLLLAGRRWMVARQYAFLRALAAATERQMPLAPVVEAFAGDQNGSWSRRARYVAHLLRAGVPLPEALQRTPGVVPAASVPLARIGQDTGRLTEALRQASSTENFYSPVWHSIVARLLYLWMLPFFFFCIVAFLFLKIVPAFVKIFQDFDVALPRLTVGVISAANLACNFWYLLAPLVVLGFFLTCYAVLRYTGWIDWDPPGIRWLARRFDTATILDALALVAQAGRPLPEGIGVLASIYPKAWIRRRLQRVGEDITGGIDWRQSLLDRRLINRADLAVLQSAGRVGNLPWALRELADSSRRRLAYRLHALVQVLFPLCVAVIGLVVLFVVAGLFMPLVTLIRTLSV
jgi:type II secretory pathway component PulF